MPERSKDWMLQAERDLAHAAHSLAAGDHEWACFAAQQAAEKALKAVFQSLNREGWGHVLIRLLESLEPHIPRIPKKLTGACRALDKFYIPTRYPNGFASGAPGEFFDQLDSQKAIEHASTILEFCRDQIG